MVSKRRINYHWRVFLPITLCLWVMIFGMFKWHENRVRNVREEMAFDQMNVVGARIVNALQRNDSLRVDNICSFSTKYYDDSENYDPMTIWIQDLNNDSIVKRYGNSILPSFTDLPSGKNGYFNIPKQYLEPGMDFDWMLYTVCVAPSSKMKIYVMLPDTKRLQEIMDPRTTYFLLMFLVIGLAATILIFISISYFSHNIKMLKNFVTQASNNPNFVVTDDSSFPHDELGDISREIVKLYNQRTAEIERSEREHKVAMNAITEKERIKRDLTGNINHELKTPVGVIQGYLDTIVETPELDAETRDKFLLKAQQNCHRLSQLIADITAITRLECGGKLVEINEINFHNLVFALDDFLKEGNVLQGKMTFSYDVPLNCLVLGNESLLKTALLNFVKNSVAYSEGTECHLTYTKEDANFYYFKYYDNGIGVPPEHLSHLFERFYRVNAGRSRTAGGTGLGLAIVEVTVKSLGGEIEVQNHFPSGLEFNFSLPKYKKVPRKPIPPLPDDED